MKTTDERMKEVMSRTHAREAASRHRRQRAVAISGGALSFTVVAAVGVGMASLVGPSASPSAGATPDLMGSVFTGGQVIGYVMAGLIGLVIGVVVTVLTFRAGQKPPVEEPQEIQGTQVPKNDCSDNLNREESTS